MTAIQANGINSNGQIVGTYTDANGSHGFLDIGGMFSSIDAPFGGVLGTFATGINDSGQVVGFYAVGNEIHGFLDFGGAFTSIEYPLRMPARAAGMGSMT